MHTMREYFEEEMWVWGFPVPKYVVKSWVGEKWFARNFGMSDLENPIGTNISNLTVFTLKKTTNTQKLESLQQNDGIFYVHTLYVARKTHSKVEIILEQRWVAFLSPSKICENLNF